MNKTSFGNLIIYSLKGIQRWEYWIGAPKKSDDENPPSHNEAGKPEGLQQTLNSINAFIMLLVISYVGKSFKLSWVSWYKIMKPFRKKPELGYKEILF